MSWQAAQSKIAPFRCPSASDDATNVAAVSHIFYDGSQYLIYGTGFFDPGTGLTLGVTNYAGCAGFAGKVSSETGKVTAVDAQSGIFYNRSKTVAGEIRDGTSSTILFGEANGVGIDDDSTATPKPIVRRPFGWMGVGVMWTAMPPIGSRESPRSLQRRPRGDRRVLLRRRRGSRP